MRSIFIVLILTFSLNGAFAAVQCGQLFNGNETNLKRFPFQENIAKVEVFKVSKPTLHSYLETLENGSLNRQLKQMKLIAKKNVQEIEASEKSNVEAKYDVVWKLFAETQSLIIATLDQQVYSRPEFLKIALNMATLVTLLEPGSQANFEMSQGNPAKALQLVAVDKVNDYSILAKDKDGIGIVTKGVRLIESTMSQEVAPVVILTLEDPSLSNLVLANVGGFVFLTVRLSNNLVFDRLNQFYKGSHNALTSLYHLCHDVFHLYARLEGPNGSNLIENEKFWRNKSWYNEANHVLDLIDKSSVSKHIKYAAKWILVYHLFEQPTFWPNIRTNLVSKKLFGITEYNRQLDPINYPDRLQLRELIRPNTTKADDPDENAQVLNVLEKGAELLIQILPQDTEQFL